MDMPQHASTDTAAAPSGWRGGLGALASMVRFHSRLPVPTLPFEASAHAPPDFRRAPRWIAAAGFVIGLPAAAVLWASGAAGLPPLMAAVLGVAVAAAVTGGLHEDGLADSIDGLAGGRTPERRLAIMKDSAIGSFGASALCLGLMLRVSGLAAIVEAAGPMAAAAAMCGAAALSRAVMLLPLALLPPARADGASAAVGRPGGVTVAVALASGSGLAAALAYGAGLPVGGVSAGLVCAVILAIAMTDWARRAIGGQTGDIAGACQQLAEMGIYVGMLIVLNASRG
jgi:adenosylcobinamide-GDP ribazoletransferase